MTITTQTLLTAAGLLAAVSALAAFGARVLDHLRSPSRQDAAIRALKEEQGLLTYGVLACLKGLKEQGCNGPVTEAIARIEKHLNQKAHE